MDDNILYGWAMSPFLPWNEIKTDEIVKLEDLSIISDDSIFGYFVECNWSYTDNIKKTEKFPIFPGKKLSSRQIYWFNDWKETNCLHTKKKVKWDWTNKKIVFSIRRCWNCIIDKEQ